LKFFAFVFKIVLSQFIETKQFIIVNFLLMVSIKDKVCLSCLFAPTLSSYQMPFIKDVRTQWRRICSVRRFCGQGGSSDISAILLKKNFDCRELCSHG